MAKQSGVEKLLNKEGAKHVVIPVSEIRFDPAFRDICRANACGFYGACWMCPPDAGDIAELMDRVRSYDRAIVFQTISPLEDSFDIESMQKASRRHNRLIRKLREIAAEQDSDFLALGAGACGGCSECARRENKPCRHPGRAVLPLEAAGVDVTQLARSAGLKYNNGPNTTTFFGALLYRDR